MLFEAAMQVAQVRNNFFYNFSIHQYFQAQYPVRGRMLRAQVNDHFLRTQIFFPELVRFRIRQVGGFVLILNTIGWHQYSILMLR